MKRSTKGALFYHVCIIVFGLFMLYPLLWMLMASFKTQEEIFTSFNFFPRSPTFEN
jgi:ABC-type glycerol-3-phosphate transport system permease component